VVAIINAEAAGRFSRNKYAAAAFPQHTGAPAKTRNPERLRAAHRLCRRGEANGYPYYEKWFVHEG
jgi:hypothetical protein